MNLLDNFISYFNPQAGLRRASARAATAALSNRYQAAVPDRSLDGWLTSGASADVEIGAALATLRNRARDLGRNNPFISKAYENLATKLVGTGIRPRLAEDVPAQVRKRTLDSWKKWADEADAEGLTDLYGLQRLVARTVVESGEALVRFYPDPSLEKQIPWIIRVLEPDWIDISLNRPLDNGGAIVQGVEFDALGRRVAYHLFTSHPGADLFTTRPSDTRVERVAADFISPVFWRTRPEQTHGVPWITPSVTTSRHFDDLQDARLKRAKVQACFAGFVHSESDGTTVDEKGHRRQQLSPGLLEYLRPGEDITFATPPRGEADDEWQVMLLHAISAGIGIPYSQLTGDLRQVNYSSMRSGALDFWDLLDGWQNLMLKPMLCAPLWRKFDQIASAKQRRARMLNVEWDFPDRPFLDPLKDGQALDAALLSGRKTFHQVLSEHGDDPEAHIEELRRERIELADLGLPHMLTAQPQKDSKVQEDEDSKVEDNDASSGE